MKKEEVAGKLTVRNARLKATKRGSAALRMHCPPPIAKCPQLPKCLPLQSKKCLVIAKCPNPLFNKCKPKNICPVLVKCPQTVLCPPETICPPITKCPPKNICPVLVKCPDPLTKCYQIEVLAKCPIPLEMCKPSNRRQDLVDPAEARDFMKEIGGIMKSIAQSPTSKAPSKSSKKK